MKFLRMALALTLAVTALAGRAHAGFNPGGTPEIDPGSLVSALALLAGGVLVVTDRCRTRR